MSSLLLLPALESLLYVIAIINTKSIFQNEYAKHASVKPKNANNIVRISIIALPPNSSCFSISDRNTTFKLKPCNLTNMEYGM